MRSLFPGAKWLYPILVLAGLIVCVVAQRGHAGTIRRISITPDQPAIVRLAFGRTTAISFLGRAEKVVPGSPQALEITFVGKDVAIRPLSAQPGNLIVYTKSQRFVLHLQIGTGTSYDDVVEITPGGSRKPIRLLQDSYRVVDLKITATSREKHKNADETSAAVPVRLVGSGVRVESRELADFLRPYPNLSCPKCTLERSGDSIRISCGNPIVRLECSSRRYWVVLEREGE